MNHVRKKTDSMVMKNRISILLTADESMYKKPLTYAQIAQKAGVTEPTVINTLRLWTTFGNLEALRIKRNPNSDNARRKITGDVEARSIAKACSAPPQRPHQMDHLPSGGRNDSHT